MLKNHECDEEVSLSQKKCVYAIIGGMGFLGQYLVHALLNSKGIDDCAAVVVIDKAPVIEGISFIFPEDFQHKKIKLYLNVDITHNERLAEMLTGAKVVFNLAALIAYGRKNKDLLHKVNTIGIMRVIESSRTVGVKKIIHVSSFATLDCLDERDKTKLAAEETCPKDWDKENFCYYGRSKYEGEQLAIQAANIEHAVVIPGILLGPGPGHHASSLPFQIAMKKKWTVVPEGGSSYIDVRDVSEGLVSLAQHSSAQGKYLLVAHHLEHRELLQQIVDLTNRSMWLSEFPRIFSPLVVNFFSFLEWILPRKSVFSKEGALQAFRYRYFTNQKAQTELNWKPKYSLQETLKDTIDWFKKEENK
jgi:nucleoside-diphosphate-sugar epimerase